MKGKYDKALTLKAPAAPMLPISTPAIAGPTMRDRLNWVELSAMPVAICRFSTMLGTIDWKDGMDSPSVTPTTSDRQITIQGCTAWKYSSKTMATGHSICTD